jgi:adenosine deaminase
MKIAEKGICIECNPTSNYLISSIGSYDKHPILKFNKYKLEPNSPDANISASINTDDIGVFDTSLENEYALMLEAIKRDRRNKGNNSMDEVYDYIDNIRKCGVEMAFK